MSRYCHVYRVVVLRNLLHYTCSIIGPFDKFIVFSPIHRLVLLLSLYSFCCRFVSQLLGFLCPYLRVNGVDSHFCLTCYCEPFLQKCRQNVFAFMKVYVLKTKGVCRMLQWVSKFFIAKNFRSLITTVIIPESNGLLPLMFKILLVLHI